MLRHFLIILVTVSPIDAARNIVLIGGENAGKSSIINSLLGASVVPVRPTRDFNSYTLQPGVTLWDTPAFRLDRADQQSFLHDLVWNIPTVSAIILVIDPNTFRDQQDVAVLRRSIGVLNAGLGADVWSRIVIALSKSNVMNEGVFLSARESIIRAFPEFALRIVSVGDAGSVYQWKLSLLDEVNGVCAGRVQAGLGVNEDGMRLFYSSFPASVEDEREVAALLRDISDLRNRIALSKRALDDEYILANSQSLERRRAWKAERLDMERSLDPNIERVFLGKNNLESFLGLDSDISDSIRILLSYF